MGAPGAVHAGGVSTAPPPDRRRARRTLTVATVLGLADAVLLGVLLWAAAVDHDTAVRILGWTHGLAFIAVVALAGFGALRRFWGWWYPALIVVTLGPPGTIVGELRLRRRLGPPA